MIDAEVIGRVTALVGIVVVFIMAVFALYVLLRVLYILSSRVFSGLALAIVAPPRYLEYICINSDICRS